MAGPAPLAGHCDGAMANYTRVREVFARFDFDHNGRLDKGEVARLMGTLKRGKWNDKQTEQLFAQVDSDGSGEVELDEFIKWVYGISAEKTEDQGRSHRRHRHKHRDEHRQKAVVLQVVHGPRVDPLIASIEQALEVKFKGTLDVQRNMDPNKRGVHSVKIMLGEGIVIWDKPTMSMYREDPFANLEAMWDWAREMAAVHLPLIMAAQKA
eukprot:TRINITY_DN5446_c4_g1_i1.p1 TRINITY_DN5446_c4_g1~~TRINITY_DN5446_c4_g1_i1.p1  ORF type:complete len:227 (+),score=39.96 TRINITY_DN5446_c4_g1_i1:53-682(+)